MSIDGAYKQVDGLKFMVSIIRGHNHKLQDSFKTYKKRRKKKKEKKEKSTAQFDLVFLMYK